MGREDNLRIRARSGGEEIEPFIVFDGPSLCAPTHPLKEPIDILHHWKFRARY
jgi:hypothetical protein